MTDSLTNREQQVAELVGDGLSYAQIAARLQNLRSTRNEAISPRTVRVHVVSIDRKIRADGGTPYRRVMRWVLDLRSAA